MGNTSWIAQPASRHNMRNLKIPKQNTKKSTRRSTRTAALSEARQESPAGADESHRLDANDTIQQTEKKSAPQRKALLKTKRLDLKQTLENIEEHLSIWEALTNSCVMKPLVSEDTPSENRAKSSKAKSTAPTTGQITDNALDQTRVDVIIKTRKLLNVLKDQIDALSK